MRKVSRLVAGAGADLQHLFPLLGIDVRSHAANDVGAGNRDAVADVEKGVVIGAGEILLQDEFLARSQKERAFVAIIGEVLIADHCAEAIKSLAEKFRLLSPLRHAPRDELLAIVRWRRHVESKGRGPLRHRQPWGKRACNQPGGASDKLTSLH